MEKRFVDSLWNKWPFKGYADTYKILENGTKPLTEESPLIRATVEAFSPENYLFTNPVAIEKAIDTNGMSVFKGVTNLLDDINRGLTHTPPEGVENFPVGKVVATTPGKVVFKNKLIELIQYSPTTEFVYKEPILIVPACIMKYYILDLEERTSMVKWLVNEGHTVFIISWHNPTKKDRNLTMADYRLGVMAAIDKVYNITGEKIHALGYCFGGIILNITAASMAKDGDDRLASLTLLATLVDFKDAGELTKLVDKNSLGLLKFLVKLQGYLDGPQMGMSFTLIRPHEVWGKYIREYLLGERDKMNSMMAWNSDVTRMSATMYLEYIEKLFLNNDLSEDRYVDELPPIKLRDINVPLFVVGAKTDYVAPYESVFKIINLVDSDVTFCLASGGHNVGIVNSPATGKGSHIIDNNEIKGSWWVTWNKWLCDKMSETRPSLQPEEGLYNAPGQYIFEK